MQVDLLHGLDLSGLDETAKLGNWLPLLLLVLVGTTASTATSTSSVTTTATVSTAIYRETSAFRPSFGHSLVRVRRTTAGCESSSCCVGHFECMGLEGIVDLVKMRNRPALRCFRGLLLCGNSQKISRTLAWACANQGTD